MSIPTGRLRQSFEQRRISLIVPALNEQDVIESTVRGIVSQVHDRFAEYEIILVDDGSTDKTGTIMDQLAAGTHSIRVLRNVTNLGLGVCYKRGIKEAKYEYVMMLCGDGGLPAASLPPIFDAIGTADIVIPHMLNLRAIKTRFRYALSRTYTTLLNVWFGQTLQYYNGLPVHRLDLLRQIDIVSSGFGFQGEILVKLLKAGCSYVEVGVLGAENTHRSSAVSLKNLAKVVKTLSHLTSSVLVSLESQGRSITRNFPEK